MKKLSLLLILCSFFAATSVFGQQWNGSGSISGNLYRNGGLSQETPQIMVVQSFMVTMKAIYFLSLVELQRVVIR
jgi:hypothetical protein